MTFEDFVEASGTLSFAKPFVERDLGKLNQRLNRFQPKRFLLQHGVYELHEGAFDEDAALDADARSGPDGPHLVIARRKHENIGFDCSGLLFIQEAHRGKGLGPEMLVQLYLLNGPDMWRRHRHFTAAGETAYRRAYELLKQRGLLP